MKVKELKALLEEEDPERVVVLSQDAEGNGFSLLSAVEHYAFDGEDIGLEVLTPELMEQGYSEEDVMKAQPALVLWP